MLVSQEKCMGWRMCISGAHTKRSTTTGRPAESEKCILCYPDWKLGRRRRACVPRGAYPLPGCIAVVDATAFPPTAMGRTVSFVDAQREMILDPFNPEVSSPAGIDGIGDRCSIQPQLAGVQIREEVEDCTPLHPVRRLPSILSASAAYQ